MTKALLSLMLLALRMSLAFSSLDIFVGDTLTHAWPPATLPGLSRADLRLLLRLRIGCHRAAERLHRLTGRGSPYCADCGDRESLEHLLLHCTALNASRIPNTPGLVFLGPLQSTCSSPHCGRDSVKRALSALLVFLDDSGVRERV
ncbi:hypothetical protein MTO96_027981 [Rhipicephalus appendiculatus]